MENLNINSENDLIFYKGKYEQVQKQRDDLQERLKIEQEKREALHNQIAAFLNPIIENKFEDLQSEFEDKLADLENRIDVIDNEEDVLDKVNEHIEDLIRDRRLTATIELD